VLAFQNFKNLLQLVKEAFFKHGDKDPLRACVKAIDFCCIESQGELQDFARNKLKELEDEIIAKLKSAIKEVLVCSMKLKCHIFCYFWISEEKPNT